MSQPEELNEMHFRRAYSLAQASTQRMEEIRNEVPPIGYFREKGAMCVPIHAPDMEIEKVRHRKRIGLYQEGLRCLGAFDIPSANRLFHECFLTQFEAFVNGLERT